MQEGDLVQQVYLHEDKQRKPDNISQKITQLLFLFNTTTFVSWFLPVVFVLHHTGGFQR
jgi:hypothetical protein